jgi:pSer/pThr/pTyr-binding forkhead associated (FHA) protein
MIFSIAIMFMSSVEDGRLLTFSSDADGSYDGSQWVLGMGRREENAVWLRYDSFASRDHAQIIRDAQGWTLKDCDSKNGTYIDNGRDDDVRVTGSVPLAVGQLFRVGRTWFRLQAGDEA